jgi:phage terminase small subunit
MKPLNPRRARFVQEYLADLDARAAATRAGYKSVVRNNHGFVLLKVPEVAAAIEAAQAKRARRVELEHDRVLLELMAVAFSDIRNVASWRDRPPARGQDGASRLQVWARDSCELSPAQAAAVASIRRTSRGGLHLRLHDKLPALALLARHLELLDGPGAAEAAAEARQAEKVDWLALMSPSQRTTLQAAIRASAPERKPGPERD